MEWIMLMGGFTLIGFILFMIGLTFYLYISIGLFEISQNSDLIGLSYLAWVPLLNFILVCLMAGKIRIKGVKVDLLLLFFVGILIAKFVPVIGGLLLWIILVAIEYIFYRRFGLEKKKSFLYAIFLIVLPIYLYKIKDQICEAIFKENNVTVLVK